MSNIEELLSKAEACWSEVVKARREAVKAERKWKDALYKWYEQEGETDAGSTPENPNRG